MKQRELSLAERKEEFHRVELARDLCAISDRLHKACSWLCQEEDLKQLLRCGDMQAVEKVAADLRAYVARVEALRKEYGVVVPK